MPRNRDRRFITDEEANITLEFGELLTLRRLLTLDDLHAEFLRDNRIEEIGYREYLRMKNNID